MAEVPIPPAVASRSNAKRWLIGLGVVLVALAGVAAWELRDKSDPDAKEPEGAKVTAIETEKKHEEPGQHGSPKSPTEVKPDSYEGMTNRLDECLGVVRKLPGYRCRFVKNERVRGKLMGYETAVMLVRHKPFSIRYHFLEPKGKKGNQAIFVEGKNDNEMLGRAGSGLLSLKGWTQLNPKGYIAMRYSRGAITSSGMQKLLEVVGKELKAQTSLFQKAKVTHRLVKVGETECELYQVDIDRKLAGEFKVSTGRILVFVNRKTSLLVRFERFDWPAKTGDPQLVEYYTYLDVKPMAFSDEAFNKNTAAPTLK